MAPPPVSTPAPLAGQPARGGTTRPGLLPALLLLLGAASLTSAPPLAADVLSSVRRPDSELAKSLCQRFRQENAANRSALAPESIAAVALSQNLSNRDAEVLITYVIEMHCSDVR